ncbi:MAG: transglycosylase SLT domain-containing protein, partial [Methylotenera sp.]
MFQLNFSHAHQFLNITHRNFKNTTIKLLTTKLVATKPATKLILSGLLAIIGVTCNVALAETNVAGEEIIIYADDTFKPAPRDLGNYNPFDIKNPAENRLGDSFDRELKVDANNEPETTTISSEDLWQRIKNGYAMPDSTSSLVTRHEEWYSSRPDYIKRMVERSQRYLFHIVEEVEKRGMPTEIALLPMIESAFNPQAYSTSSASGIWQFIPSTGKHFGLKQNWWVDNRRNVTFATDAALEYLQKLYGMFGSWDLALAAYNAGEGTVGRAIERNRKLGLPTNYESLSLPTETKNYVPKLQAIKNLMTNPGDYGLKIQTIANTPYFTKVSAPAQIDSHLAAKFAEITDSEFLALNPSYNRPVITGSGDKHELLLPILSAQTFRNNLATYDKPLVSWQTYYAKRG